MQILLFPEVEAMGFHKLVGCCKCFARIPWSSWAELVAPHYDAAIGRSACGCSLEVMLRIHCVQHYFGLSDAAMAHALQEQSSVRRLVGLPPTRRTAPGEREINYLRCLLESHRLAERDLESAGLLA